MEKPRLNEQYTDNDYKGIDEDSFFMTEINTQSNDESKINQWVNNIFIISKSKASITGNRLNAYYCPNIVKQLLLISRKFPLWTSVMVKFFGSPNIRGSSARIEGYFASLKTSIISKKLPKMRVDKFLVTHLRAIRGDIKLAQNNVNKTNNNLKSNTNVNIYEKNQLDQNWKDVIFKQQTENLVNDPNYLMSDINKKKSLLTDIILNSQTDVDKADEENVTQMTHS